MSDATAPAPNVEHAPITLNGLTRDVHAWGTSKGWNDREVPLPEMVALIHSEASEALESWRNGEPTSWTRENPLQPDAGKPEGVASEFADIVIRIAHYSALLGIDLEAEVRRKMAYNATRPHRHGGKRG